MPDPNPLVPWLVLVGIVIQGAVAIIVQLIRRRITTLEKNTNSIKDQLVATTAALSRAQGRLEGRAELQAETDTKARNR